MKPTRFYWLKVIICVLIGIPFAAVGALLCASIVFAPLGVALLVLSGAPLAWQQKRHLERKVKWEQRDRPLEQSTTPPWLLDEYGPDA